jgi:hypothetical protein
MHQAELLSHAYDQLSLRDLLEVGDQYYVFLWAQTSCHGGRYRIRRKDNWPTPKGPRKIHRRYARTLENSEVRYYSWRWTTTSYASSLWRIVSFHDFPGFRRPKSQKNR